MNNLFAKSLILLNQKDYIKIRPEVIVYIEYIPYFFLVAYTYTLWQPFVAYFRSDIDIIAFFCFGGIKMSGSARLFKKKITSGAQRWAGDGKHKQKYGHPNNHGNI